MASGNHSIPMDEGPGLYYLGADGNLTLLDQDLTRMDDLERAIARALVTYAQRRLNQAELDQRAGLSAAAHPDRPR